MIKYINNIFFTKKLNYSKQFFLSILIGLIFAGLFSTGMYALAVYGVDEPFPLGNTTEPTCAPGSSANCTVTPPAAYSFSGNSFSGTGEFHIQSNSSKLYFGPNDNASMYYNGTNLVINPSSGGNILTVGAGTISSYRLKFDTAGSDGIISWNNAGTDHYFAFNNDVDLVQYNLTTTGTVDAGSIKAPYIYPSSNSTTAFQIRKADASTSVLNVDTTNGRVGVGTTSPAQTLDVNGTAKATNIIDTGLTASKLVFTDANKQLTSTGIGTSSQFIKGDGSLDSTTYGTFTLPSLTSGSVLFSNGTTITQDNTNFFWDDTNNRLGIGTKTPATELDLATGTLQFSNGGAWMKINSNASGGVITSYNNLTIIPTNGSGVSFSSSGDSVSLTGGYNGGTGAGTSVSIIGGGYGNSALPGNVTLQGGVNGSSVYGDVLLQTTGGKVGIGKTSPGSALDIKGELRLSGATSGYVGFAPAAAAGSTTYTLPSADGSSGQVLSTNGSGTLSWDTPTASDTDWTWNATYNNMYGSEAGNGTMTGTHNFFVGELAGNKNTTGYANNFLGNQTGYFNTTGYHNNFLGQYAGYSNTTGSENNFFGTQAGFLNTTGYSNNFLGFHTGYANTTGNYNNFLGYYAGYLNATGYDNNFLGQYAGYSNTTGYSNNFFGNRAGLNNSTGNYNNFLGYYTGFANTTGNYNNFIGTQAGQANTTGNYNNFIGLGAGYLNTTGYDNNFLGSYVGYNNTTGYDNNFSGYYAGYSNTTGSQNNFLGYNAGYSNQTGSNDVFIGSYAGYGITDGNTLVIDSTPSGRGGNDAIYSLIYGKFSGTGPSEQSLTVNADEFKLPYLPAGGGSSNVYWDSGSGTLYQASSSLRYKTNVQPLVDDFSKILQIQPKTFKYKSTGTQDLGYIAEEFDAIGLKSLVNYDKLGRPDSLKYDRIPMYLTEIVKQQQLDINALKISAGLSASGATGSGSISGVGSSNTIVQAISSLLSSVGITIQNGITYIKNLNADTATIKGLQLVDQDTGDIYCTWVKSGEMMKAKGDCETVFANLAVNGTATVIGSTTTPVTQEQLTQATEAVTKTAEIVQKVTQTVEQSQQPVEQAVQQAQQAAQNAVEAAQQAQQAVQQVEAAPAPEQETPSGEATEQEQATPEEQAAPAQPELVPAPAPVEEPVATGSDISAGDVIKSGTSSLINGVTNLIKSIFSNVFSSAKSSTPQFIQKLFANMSQSIKADAVNLKQSLNDGSVKIENNAKLIKASLFQPAYDLWNNIITKFGK